MKLTRKSYKRKIVTFGVMLVLAISLISTGFAAWIISQSSQEETNGNVEVGVVTDKSIEITDLKFIADCYYDHGTSQDVEVTLAETKGDKPLAFSFNPAYGDINGHIKFDKDAYDKAYAENNPYNPNNGVEALKIKFTGKILHASMLDQIQVDLEVPASLEAAVNAGYIVLPACAYYKSETPTLNTHELVPGTEKSEIDTASDSLTFEYTVEFKWGEKFGGVNPSLFFDNPENPESKYTVEEINIILQDLRAKMLGASQTSEKTFDGTRTYPTYDKAALDKIVAPQFKLTITATAN